MIDDRMLKLSKYITLLPIVSFIDSLILHCLSLKRIAIIINW